MGRSLYPPLTSSLWLSHHPYNWQLPRFYNLQPRAPMTLTHISKSLYLICIYIGKFSQLSPPQPELQDGPPPTPGPPVSPLPHLRRWQLLHSSTQPPHHSSITPTHPRAFALAVPLQGPFSWSSHTTSSLNCFTLNCFKSHLVRGPPLVPPRPSDWPCCDSPWHSHYLTYYLSIVCSLIGSPTRMGRFSVLLTVIARATRRQAGTEQAHIHVMNMKRKVPHTEDDLKKIHSSPG